MLRIQKQLLFVATGMMLSSADDDSDSLGSESSGSGSSDASSGSSDEISSLSCLYSSSDSSSPDSGDRRRYRRNMRGNHSYSNHDYQQIPRRR